MSTSPPSDTRSRRSIMSSDHLAGEFSTGLSEYEYGLMIAYQGFTRWVNRCMAAAGTQGMSTLEILVLHHLNHRSRAKRLSDIVFQLNVDDPHTVNYALKKLKAADLIEAERRGKEIFYKTTQKGVALCGAYREVRESCLVNGLDALEMNSEDLSKLASVLRVLSGFYEQASRAAASL